MPKRSAIVAIAEERYPRAGWIEVEGHHDECFVVSPHDGRADGWDRETAAAVAAEVVAAASLRLSKVSATSARFGHCNRAYVAVQCIDGGWVVVDAFMRFDDSDTLPFDPPQARKK